MAWDYFICRGLHNDSFPTSPLDFGLIPDRKRFSQTKDRLSMKLLLQEIRRNPLLWLLVFDPVALAAEKLNHEAHTLHFILSILAILPLAILLSHATESVAVKTGDSVGGLLNATLGNLTELVIAIAALQAGQYTLVKASIAGAIVTNSLFMLGASFLLGGVRYHLQEFNRIAARFQAGLLFLATIGLLIPTAVARNESLGASGLNQTLSLALSFLLLLAYGLGLWFSLKTHRELFAGAAEEHEAAWPIGLAIATLACVTILVALVSEVFVGSVQHAATAFGMSPAFVGFIVVALVGAAAEMAAAFSAARKNHLDLSVSIALGSAAQIALFVAPVLVLLSYFLGPRPMDLNFWPGAVVMILLATLTASLVTASGRSAWFVGALAIMVYVIFATALYLLPPTGTI
jgi:Ca2+:H+ antiporter